MKLSQLSKKTTETKKSHHNLFDKHENQLIMLSYNPLEDDCNKRQGNVANDINENGIDEKFPEHKEMDIFTRLGNDKNPEVNNLN